MSNVDETQSTLPTRALCQVIQEANWYTNVLVTQSDFRQCLLLRPELQKMAEKVCSFEQRIFTGLDSDSDSQVYAELRTLLRYHPPSSTAPSFFAQVSETGVGTAWAKFHLLILYYRLFDRVWLYNSPLNRDILVHPNKLQLCSYESFHHIQNVKTLLQKFRKLCKPNAKLTAGEHGDTIVRYTHFSARLPKGSGLVQQLKDLAELDDTTQLVRIQRNLLIAALNLNWICQAETEGAPSESSLMQTQSSTESPTSLEGSSDLQAIISHRNRSGDLSDEEVQKLKNMFKKKDGSSKDVVHKNLLIILGISPLFLLATVQLHKSSKWSNINIYKDSQLLGNWHSELLVRIEKTIFDTVFDIASGSMDAAQALMHIVTNLPWEEIDAMSIEDPSNIRFRYAAAPSQTMQSTKTSSSSVALSSVHKPQNTTDAGASGVTPLPRALRLPTPSPTRTLPPDTPLSRNPSHTPSPPPPFTPPPPDHRSLREQEFGGDGGSPMATGNGDEDMDIDQRPARITRATAKARNPPSALPIPLPEPTDSSGKKEKTAKRKRDKPTNPSDKGVVHHTPFPQTLPPMPDINLDVGKKFPVPKQTPPYTLFCAKGQPHEVVFHAHSEKMLAFWHGTMASVRRSYIDQKALHVIDPTRSTFSVISHSALQKKSVAEKLELLRRGPILETDRPTEPMSFDIDGLKSLGCSLEKIIDIQDQSSSANQATWLRKGTLKQMLQCPPGKALNALSLPMPEGSHSAGKLSTDYVAWEEAARVKSNIENNAPRPTAITRWGLCATANASHTLHIDSDGLNTFVEVLTGTKIWVVLTSKENVTDFSEFAEIDRYLRDTLEVPDTETCEAVVLTPGTRLYMRPNMMHAVHTSENAICHGGHFYASCTMKDTLCGMIHAFSAFQYVTNNSLEQSRSLLRQIMVFFATELQYPSLDTEDSATHHLPKLNPSKSGDSEMNTIEAAEQLFATCSLAIFMSILHPDTYLHPDACDSDKPSEKKRQEMEMEKYDRNMMSLEERFACAGARAMAYNILRWFAKNYRFVPINGQPPKQCQELLDEKLAEQAFAIYLAKEKAVEAKIPGYQGCSLHALKRQLLGTFPIQSGPQHFLEGHFQENTQLQYIHADFSNWDLEVISTPTCEDNAANECWMELTPLDIKFSDGFNVDFQIDSTEYPEKRRKVV